MEIILIRVLITGVGGFIGSHMASYMSEMNYEIVGLDRILNKEVKYIVNEYITNELSECDANRFSGKPIDYIVHCAGVASVDAHEKMTNEDYKATKNLVDIAIKNHVKKIIFLSSNKVDSTAESAYSKSKNTIEKLIETELQDTDISYTFIRSSIVYGVGMGSNIYTWLNMINQKNIPALPASESQILMISVNDLCACIEKCFANNITDNKAYIISDGNIYGINEIETNARKVFGKSTRYFVCPRFLLYIASKLGDIFSILNIRLPINSRIYNMLFSNYVLIPNEFNKETGFEPSTNFLNEIPRIFT